MTDMSFADIVKTAGSLMRGERDDVSSTIYDYIESGGYDKDWSDERVPGYHPSSMFFLCPRQELLKKQIPKITQPRFDLTMLLKFNHGHALHYWFQHRLLGPTGLIIGEWACLRCNDKTSGTMPSKCPCGAGRDCISFVERKIYREPFVGHIDGEIILSSGRALLELKSTNYYLNKIVEPLDYNVYQANIYMWATGIHQTLMVYISKPQSLRMKMFLVKFDQGMLDDALEKVEHSKVIRAMSDKEMRKANPADSIGICASMGCFTASKCAWVNECFRGR